MVPNAQTGGRIETYSPNGPMHSTKHQERERVIPLWNQVPCRVDHLQEGAFVGARETAPTVMENPTMSHAHRQGALSMFPTSIESCDTRRRCHTTSVVDDRGKSAEYHLLL